MNTEDKIEELVERTDGRMVRKENREKLDEQFESDEGYEQLKELGPEGIYEKYGLVYVL